MNNGIGATMAFEGSKNTAIGSKALHANTIGFGNTATGYQSLYSNSSGNYNTAFGITSLHTNTEGYENTAVGYSALLLNTTGGNNTAVGSGALLVNSTGHSNVAIGSRALLNNTDRSNIVAVGDSALFNNGIGATYSFESMELVSSGMRNQIRLLVQKVSLPIPQAWPIQLSDISRSQIILPAKEIRLLGIFPCMITPLDPRMWR